jgi:hypothetical protein
MKNLFIAFIFAVAALAVPALAQTAQLPLSLPIEKELAARASEATEITLDKKMLSLASRVMDGNDTYDDATRKLIENLDGIYIRNYEFDKEGLFTTEQVEQLRKYFETGEWSSLVRNRDRKTGESSDIMVKLVNGESHGLFILNVEPKEISIVLVLGPIQMSDLKKVKHIVKGVVKGRGGAEKSMPAKGKSTGTSGNQ